ncbi:MAG TPA: putative toxin-antitoxin system toxin component, PIN family [Aromatoleum sp.]|uniref:putative toxin-antitoxin system toxin component, PIN family n=1 Tax=Aromatoleum sp. TaxID=2307007 RepID=UPI002B4A1E5A|nr:putative toxin-antitoxin system toxin component, PIN family [Aromatoleum sp.]HJV26522.1 putative toxin-antitoxin system toxin component, PIN family [Aromatoleum sp.]
MTVPPSSLRLVLDTNTVMALWFFEDPRLESLRRMIEDMRPTLVARADALDELRHVLAYRQFGIEPARQAELLAAYSARVTTTDAMGGDATPATDAEDISALPTCRDRDDQKFLEIARDGRATHLVSRDKALLRLNRHRLVRPLFAILTPETLNASLTAQPHAVALQIAG